MLSVSGIPSPPWESGKPLAKGSARTAGNAALPVKPGLFPLEQPERGPAFLVGLREAGAGRMFFHLGPTEEPWDKPR